MNKKELSIIIPSYLEGENLNIILPRLKDVLDEINISYEILIIDTVEQMDNTKEICERNKVFYINREGGNSYGDAVRTGIDKADSNFIIFMDADGSHTPEFIKNIYANRFNNDVVIASRYVEGGDTDNSKILILMSLVVNIIYSLVLNLNCKDVSNSFKLYKTSDMKKLKLKCNNFDIVEEILFKLKRNNKNLSIKEIPYVFKKRMFGNTKRNLFLFILTYFFTLIKLRFSVVSDFRIPRLDSPFWNSFISFCFVGLLGTLTNLAVFYTAIKYLNFDINISAVLAFAVAVTQNYIFNHLWSFNIKDKLSHKSYIKYVIVNLISLGFNILILNLLINFGANILLAQLVGIIFGTIISYAGSYLFVFINKKKFVD